MTAVTPISASSDHSFPRTPTSSSNDTLSLPSIPPNTVFPRPLFIGITAAVLIVTTDHEIRLEQHGIEPSAKSVQVSNTALDLVNEFLDQLLLDFLSKSKSLSMSALRIAVSEILKPKLARSAMQCADQDLQEYLEIGEGADVPTISPDPDLIRSDWLVELWRKVRLRCMAYSSLRDIQEKDIILDIEESIPMPSTVAIFLASILEFMGEQALIVAGTAAHHRSQTEQSFDKDENTTKISGVRENLIVEVNDMECIALDRTLGRLWRGWRLRLESPSTYLTNKFSGSMDLKKLQPLLAENHMNTLLNDHTTIECSKFVKTCLAHLDLAVKDPATSKKYVTDRASKLYKSDQECSEVEEIGSKYMISSVDVFPNTVSISETKIREKKQRAYSVPWSVQFGHSSSDQWCQPMCRREENNLNDEEFISTTHQNGPPVLPLFHSNLDKTLDEIPTEATTGSEILPRSSLTASGSPTQVDNSCETSSIISYSEPTCKRLTTQLSTKRRPISFNCLSGNLFQTSRPTLRSHPTWPSASELENNNYMTLAECQLKKTDICEQGIDKIMTTETELIITDNEESASEDGRVTPSAVAFAEAVQGIDTYFFDPSFVTSNTNKDKKSYPVVVHQTKLYTSSYAVEDIARSPSVDETEVKISPVSLPADEPVMTSHGSPTSTVSSMEKTIDQNTHATTLSGLNLTQGSQDGSPEKSSPDQDLKRAIHTSSSASSSISHRLIVVRTSEEGAMENFDQLIQSDQTIQYTLTPQNVRIASSPDPRHILAETDNEKRPIAARSISSPATKCITTKSSLSKRSLDDVMSGRLVTPILEPDYSMTVKTLTNITQPRDTRTTQELPINDLTKIVRNILPTPLAPINQGSSFRSVKNSLLQATPSLYKKHPARTKLQSREAVTQRDEGISDLIDFVRSGPQLENGRHRIPISVAPFNSNLDEDEPAGSIPDSPLPEPRYYQTSPSVNSSVTSQTALLVSSSKNKHANLYNESRLEEKLKPSKRNLIDPLSIETSDNEDYETSGLNLSREESLADFLKNSSPPEQIIGPIDRTNQSKTTTKNAHSSVLLSIFGRGSTSTHLPSKATHKVILKDVSPDSGATNSPDANQSERSSNVPQIRPTHTRVQQKTYEPREAAISNFRTRDLAEFLMSHDPPPTENEPKLFYSTSKKAESSSLQKIFGRKKTSISPKP